MGSTLTATMDRLASLFANPIKPATLKPDDEKTRSLVSAASDDYSCEFGSTKYYALCAVGGALSCGLTHTAVTPLDLVKCRLQVNKEKYKPRAECSKSEQLVVTFAAGYIAGVFCAVVSHPADTIVSYMNKASGSGIGDAAKALGFSGMWAGLGPRIIMIGTLTALQWFIYDGVKVQLRLPRPPPPGMPESLKIKLGLAQD